MADQLDDRALAAILDPLSIEQVVAIQDYCAETGCTIEEFIEHVASVPGGAVDQLNEKSGLRFDHLSASAVAAIMMLANGTPTRG